MADQLQLFFGGGDGDRFHCVFDAFVEIERGGIELHHARFDFGKIQHVADHGQQRFARGDDGFKIRALLVVRGEVQGQFGHADHAIQRSADLMAHIGHEFALRPAGELGGFLGGFGRLLGRLRHLFRRAQIAGSVFHQQTQLQFAPPVGP